jgi:hypothetical protein
MNEVIMNTPEVREKHEQKAFQQWGENVWNDPSWTTPHEEENEWKNQDLFHTLRSNVAHLQELQDRMGFILREVKYLIKPNL